MVVVAEETTPTPKDPVPVTISMLRLVHCRTPTSERSKTPPPDRLRRAVDCRPALGAGQAVCHPALVAGLVVCRPVPAVAAADCPVAQDRERVQIRTGTPR